MRSIAQDVRFALRQMRRAPVFAISAILTLAMGIGANTGIFSLLNGYLRPLPVPDADRIVVIAAQLPGDDTGFRFRFSYPALKDFRAETSVFADVFGFDNRISGMTTGGRTTQFLYHTVTGNFFSGLRMTPLLGRFFEPGEGEHAGGEMVVVLGHRYWQQRFGGDPAVVGRAVRVDGNPARIIGVAPAAFHGLYQGADIEGYIPIGAPRGAPDASPRIFTDRSFKALTAVARLQPGVTIETAQQAVDVIAARQRRDHPEDKDVTARVLPERLARPIPITFLSSLIPLIQASMLGLALLVLIIACMNVANLLLVRASVRQREMALRAALGSGRVRTIRLLLIESAIIAAAGTAAGLVLARWATGLFIGTLDVGVDVPLNLDFDYDWRVFGYAAALACATGAALGLAPAIKASRADVNALLHDGGHGSSAGAGRQRMRGALVVTQVAGSLVLLVVAGLCVRTLQRAQWIDLGFDPANVMTVRIDPRQVGYDRVRATAFYDELDRRVRALPGVESVSMAFSMPMGYIFDGTAIEAEGRPPDAGQTGPSVGYTPVTAEYFDTLGIPIVSGRAFSAVDVIDSEPVVILNETLARRLWPGGEPLGRRVVTRGEKTVYWKVVGVARDSKYMAVFEPPLPYAYFCMPQAPSSLRMVFVRSAVPPATLGPLLEREIHALDPDVPIADLKPMREIVTGNVGFLMFRVGAVQAGAMGVVGLLLAVVGVYGVVSYGAAQRMREMGIRVALGAGARDILALVLSQGAWLVVTGIAIGLLGAAGVARTLSRFFYMVDALDTGTFAAVTALLAMVALVACYLPARRATRVDPIVVLRHD